MSEIKDIAKVKERPGLIVFGKTIKERTPWGSIYVTLNFDGDGPFEVFITFGKSGSELNAMTEALARVISIGLRSGCRLEDFIATLKGLSGKEIWMFDCDEEQVIRSLPDAVARLLEKLLEGDSVAKASQESENPESDGETRGQTPEARKDPEPPPHHDTGMICPQCGAPMEPVSGCAYCFSCGYSPCK